MASAGKAAVVAAAAVAASPAVATPAATATTAAVAANDNGVFDHLLPTGCLLRQYFEPDSSTYTYLIGDTGGGGHPPTGTGVLIDPVDVTAERDAAAAAAAGVTVSHAINTHVHADHVTGTGVLKRMLTPPPLSVLSVAAGGAADVHVPPGWVLRVGRLRLTSVATPGHTAGCQSLLLSVDAGSGGGEGGGGADAAATAAAASPASPSSAAVAGGGTGDLPPPAAAPPAADPVAVFTGDALLIGGCGRTDFQGGDAATLYRSVRGRLLTALPPATVVLPAHDYHARRASTVGAERADNARLRDGISEAAFVELMAALRLPMPRRIDEAVPANLRCGG